MFREHENIAGGMYYRTMDGIDVSQISKYLEGHDPQSKKAIIEKNKVYYIASANKIIARLKLAKTRAIYGNLNDNTAKIVFKKISEGIEWLESLIINMKYGNKLDLLEYSQYKKWHAVKLISSAVEGYIIVSAIQRKIDNSTGSYETDKQKLKNAIQHNNKAEMIFKELLKVDGNSDLNKYEKSRIDGYNETVMAEKILKSILK